MCSSCSRPPHLSLPYEKHLVFLLLLFVLVMPNTTVYYGIQIHNEYFSTNRSLGCFVLSMHVYNWVCRHSYILWCGGQRLIILINYFLLPLLRQGFLLYPELTELASLVYRFVLGDPIYTLSTRIMGRLPHPSWIPVVDGDLSFGPHSYVGVSPIEFSSKFYVFPKWGEDWFLLNT